MKRLMARFGGIKTLYGKIRAAVQRFNSRMSAKYVPWQLAAVATAILAIGLIVQLFLPPFLGMSNDGSFDTVLQDVGLVRMNPDDATAYFSYYERQYVISPQPHTPDTTPWLLKAVVKAAIGLDSLFTRDGVFDMRFLAAIYGVCYLAAAFFLMRGLMSRVQLYSEGIGLAVLGVLMMGDTALVTRFASLYTQPLEWILLIAIVDTIFFIADKEGRGFGPVLLCAEVALLMSVNKYAALGGIVFSIIYWMLTGLKLDGLVRALYMLLAMALTVLSVVQTAHLIQNQTPSQKYDQMTRGVLFQSTNPEDALAEFGISPRFSLLTDTYAQQAFPVALLDSQVIQEEFLAQYDTKEIGIYYLRHPMSILGLFDVGVQQSFAARPSYSGNFEESVGLPPMAKSPFPALWSTFKEQSAPKTVGSIFIVVMVIALLRRRKQGKGDRRIELNRNMLDVVLIFAAVELGTVLLMSGDSELLRESFIMGTSIDVLVLIFITELLHKTKIVK